MKTYITKYWLSEKELKWVKEIAKSRSNQTSEYARNAGPGNPGLMSAMGDTPEKRNYIQHYTGAITEMAVARYWDGKMRGPDAVGSDLHKPDVVLPDGTGLAVRGTHWDPPYFRTFRMEYIEQSDEIVVCRYQPHLINLVVIAGRTSVDYFRKNHVVGDLKHGETMYLSSDDFPPWEE